MKNITKIFDFEVHHKQDFVLVEGGTFMMGDTFGDGLNNEKPAHQVTLTYDFYIGKYPVTQKEYNLLMGENTSYFKGENLPVDSVTWFEAIKYCNKLSIKKGVPIAYRENGELLNKYGNITIDITKVLGYRLPTEAEWEYAAIGGKYSKGYKYSGSNNVNEVAWYKENSNIKTHEVGLKKANELGIYDMSGNVWEWCTDWYNSYTSLPNIINPYIYTKTSYQILRGGSWAYDASIIRVSYRRSNIPSNSGNFIGFRVVKNKY